MKKIKKYKIQNKMIAKWFNYSTEFSFANSSSSTDVKNGIEKVIEYIEECIIEEINK